MHVSAVIAAGGKGRRMNSSISKQFLNIKGRPILYYTLKKFERIDKIKSIILVVGADDIDFTREEIVKRYKFKKIKIVQGGKERQDSVYNGLRELSPQTDIVVIHDGVRPFVPVTIIEKSIAAAAKYKAVGVAVPVKDTIKVVDDNYTIKNTPDRKTLWAMQTPQSFTYDVIMRAYEKAMCDGFYGTDDTVLVERLGLTVKIIEGAYENIKITTPEDIIFAETFINLGYGHYWR
ncbi:2-C-methyl-D-erythritol 4-phosphate cytidylyltransferase [Tepidanaerobacter sp. GT38]|uniref:2-C-methyl-D-erythritol 4-phosphate cytidylyltransferase n=1 Tax=Tepidanaerobacter sp. GT38 TaxID=2722793 RepID=UPI001EFF92FC|nr:2-C-methyl-D-erythritol 4-phosphate cytidylyltransferase [Tepidanaerobacter sp. GT38]MCG1012356.1 2-C-methyl-D-erythritol 4-phosphate cytidylyltransferase [Tepidanaerobacter sp. GT38]